MSVFELYFRMGIAHIADLRGYDHILFIIILCAVYSIRDWKRIIILVTAFTIGHSLTLVLATINLIQVNRDLIEFLIPLTIFLTALANVISRKERVSRTMHYLKYGAALFFGLIHGLGFSSYLTSLLGKEQNIAMPLFSFNLGIEVGQLLIVMLILLATFLVVDLLKFRKREWNVMLAGAGLGISLVLMIERLPW